MGCMFSRQDYDDDPRIFNVWNVDSDGRPLKPGRIEVTSSQLILFQKENMVVRWPLTSLRRYGFDSEVFSFECGRRCSTGAGVYAFKCRRAQALFAALQESINSSTAAEQPTPAQPPPLPAPTAAGSPAEDADGYLEPIRNNNAAGPTTPGGYVCIHGDAGEWRPHYENSEVLEQQAGCSNAMCMVNRYAAADPPPSAQTPPPSDGVVTLSPSQLPCCRHCVDYNTNYAKLDDLLKQEQKQRTHFYVNVKPDSVSSVSSKCASGRSTPEGGDHPHCYANLTQQQVNYAVLDLDRGPLEPCPVASPAHSPEGYAQIDFDKTVALSNSVNPCAAFNDDSMRKTRHNPVIPCASMSA